MMLVELALALGMASCATISGEHIEARDLTPVEPAFSGIAPGTVLGYSPVPGARRIFRAAELARLSQQYGFALDAPHDVCVERDMQSLTREALEAAMRVALEGPQATIEILEWSRYPVPRGPIEFARSGLRAPPRGAETHAVLWRGFVRYAAGRRFAMWARVRISVSVDRVVAVKTLTAGKIIQAADVTVETVDGFPGAIPAAHALDEVAGQIPRRAIPAGSPVFPAILDAPAEVARGDQVVVEVLSGRAKLKLEARAESQGRRGDLIPVRNPATGKTFRARVAGPGKLLLAPRDGAPVGSQHPTGEK
jgi:flagella basal body P-ring formation protein FlgA